MSGKVAFLLCALVSNIGFFAGWYAFGWTFFQRDKAIIVCDRRVEGTCEVVRP